MRYLVILIAIFCSCSSAKKSTETRQSAIRQTDNSVTNTNYMRETTTVEKTTTLAVVPVDSLKTEGYVPVGDTGKMVSESDNMTITTISIPVKDSAGKTIGSKINTKATTKPKTVGVPVDRQTHVVESGAQSEKKDMSTTTTDQNKTINKTVWRPTAGIQVVIGLVVIAVLLFGIYKFLKR